MKQSIVLSKKNIVKDAERISQKSDMPTAMSKAVELEILRKRMMRLTVASSDNSVIWTQRKWTGGRSRFRFLWESSIRAGEDLAMTTVRSSVYNIWYGCT